MSCNAALSLAHFYETNNRLLIYATHNKFDIINVVLNVEGFWFNAFNHCVN